MKKLNILVACEYSGAVRQRLRDLGHNAWSCDLLPADDGSIYHYQGDVFDLIDGKPYLDGFADTFTGCAECPALFNTAAGPLRWDVLIGFPPCTYLTVSGAWLFAERKDIKRNVADGVLTGAERVAARTDAVNFVNRLLHCGIPQVILENPSRSFLCTALRKPDQVVHPYMFGDDASKSTGFWLNGDLPGLKVPLKFDWVAPRYVASTKTDKLLPRWGNQTDSGQNAEPPAADRWKKRSDTWPGIADALASSIDLWNQL